MKNRAFQVEVASLKLKADSEPSRAQDRSTPFICMHWNSGLPNTQLLLNLMVFSSFFLLPPCSFKFTIFPSWRLREICSKWHTRSALLKYICTGIDMESVAVKWSEQTYLHSHLHFHSSCSCRLSPERGDIMGADVVKSGLGVCCLSLPPARPSRQSIGQAMKQLAS